MNIFIDNRSGDPIYQQIFTQIRSQIIDGTLRHNDALPSMRSLAKDLRISVITTKRAYEELERAGVIYTVPGKGSFIAGENAELLREESLRQIEEHLEQVAVLAAAAGVSRAEIGEMYAMFAPDHTGQPVHTEPAGTENNGGTDE